MCDWDVLEADFSERTTDYFTVIVFYDIISNKRRVKLSKILSGYGYRVQKSVFECSLSRKAFGKLTEEIDKFVESDDLIRIYRLNQGVEYKIYGENYYEDSDEIFFI